MCNAGDWGSAAATALTGCSASPVRECTTSIRQARPGHAPTRRPRCTFGLIGHLRLVVSRPPHHGSPGHFYLCPTWFATAILRVAQPDPGLIATRDVAVRDGAGTVTASTWSGWACPA